jgi:hypothetical protein
MLSSPPREFQMTSCCCGQPQMGVGVVLRGRPGIAVQVFGVVLVGRPRLVIRPDSRSSRERARVNKGSGFVQLWSGMRMFR